METRLAALPRWCRTAGVENSVIPAKSLSSMNSLGSRPQRVRTAYWTLAHSTSAKCVSAALPLSPSCLPVPLS